MCPIFRVRLRSGKGFCLGLRFSGSWQCSFELPSSAGRVVVGVVRARRAIIIIIIDGGGWQTTAIIIISSSGSRGGVGQRIFK